MSLEKQKDRIEKIRIQMLLRYPFYGKMACFSEPIVSTKVPTAATDGERIWFNPDFMEKLNDKELLYVYVHELLHIVLRHQFRVRKRNMMKFNVAADYVINDILESENLQKPRKEIIEVLHDPKRFTKDDLEEDVYEKIPDKESQNNSVNGVGDVIESPHPAGSVEESQANAKIDKAISTAAQTAKERGQLGGFLKRFDPELQEPQINWKEKLRRFCRPILEKNFSWNVPNRRLLEIGYFPGREKSSCPRVTICIDSSGSISDKEMNVFLSEMNGILRDSEPEKIEVFWFHSSNWRHDTLQMGEELKIPDEMETGGTCIENTFDLIEEENISSPVTIILTDMYLNFPENYPKNSRILWVGTTKDIEPEYGDFIHLEL